MDNQNPNDSCLFKHILFTIRQQSHKYNYIKSFCIRYRVYTDEMKMIKIESLLFTYPEKRFDWAIKAWTASKITKFSA